jgi:hypothetical protein
MKPKLKLKVRTRYLASIFSGAGITIRKDGLAAYPDLDFSGFSPITIFNPAEETVLLQNVDGSFSKLSLSNLTNTTLNRRVITAAGSVTVGVSDGLIILAKTVAEDTDFLLPADTSKIGAVKIVDWNGVGGTQILRAVPNGTETISGQAAWQISGAYGSIVLSPTGAGLGYSV